MAIKIQGTTVITDDRNVTNIGNLNISGVATVGANTALQSALTVAGPTTLTGLLTAANTTITGTATIATVDINGGAIDGTTIGSSVAAAANFTNLVATAITGPLTGDVTGDVTGDLTGNVTATSGDTTLNNLTVNGTADFTDARLQNVADPQVPSDGANQIYVDATATALAIALG